MTTMIPPTVPDLTDNRLQEFDVALSLSENAINAQLENAWTLWCARDGGFDKLPAPGGSPGAPAVVLGVPTIAIDPSGGPAEIAVRFPFSWRQSPAPDAKAAASQDDTLVYRASLFQHRLDEAELKQVDGASADRVAQIIEQAGRADGVFSIECLFVDFTTLRNIGGAPAPGRQGAAAEAARVVERFAGGRKVLLQTVVCPRKTPRPATFMIKDFAFKVTRSKDRARASTIDYLGVFHGQRDMPGASSRDGALARLDSWLDLARTTATPTPGGELVAGVMTIRGDLFRARVVEGLRAALAARYADMKAQNDIKRAERRIANPAIDLAYPEAELFQDMLIDATDKGFKVSENPAHNRYTWKDGALDCKLVKRLTLEFESVPGNGYRIRGAISADYSRDDTGFLGSRTTSTMQASITGTLSLASRVARDGKRPPFGANIVPELALTIGEFEETSGASILRILTGSIVGLVQQIVTSAYARDARTAVAATLSDAVANINVSLVDLPFIPPGEEVFTFKLPRFTRRGDLMLDVIYRATLPQAGQSTKQQGARP